MTELAKRMGQRLKAERRRQGLTQGDLGSYTGLKGSAISHFETGRRTPSAPNLRRLCLALMCSADYLLDIVPDMRPKTDPSRKATVPVCGNCGCMLVAVGKRLRCDECGVFAASERAGDPTGATMQTRFTI